MSAAAEPSGTPLAEAPRRATWRTIAHRVLVAVFLVLLGVGVVTTVRGQDWTPVRQLAGQLDVAVVVAALGCAMLLNAVGLMFGLASWRVLFADLGADVSTWTALRIVLVGFLAKFVPGRFVALPILLTMGRALDIGAVRLGSIFAVSWSLVIGTGLAVGLAAGPAVAGAGMGLGWLAAAAALVMGLLMVRADLVNRAAAVVARRLRRPPPDVALSNRGMRRAILAQVLSWVISGHHLWLLAVVAGAPPTRSYLVCVAGFAVATVAGIVVLFAPDGIGVREAVLMIGLTTVMPVPLAGTVVLASRLVCTLSELAVGGGGLMLAQRNHRRALVASQSH